MATDVQIVIDCADPHGLADWWAEALGWHVEPQEEAFIRRMVASGAATEADTTTHRGALVWRSGSDAPWPARRTSRRKMTELAAWALRHPSSATAI